MKFENIKWVFFVCDKCYINFVDLNVDVYK